MLCVLGRGRQQNERRPAAGGWNAGAKQIDARRAPAVGQAQPLEPRRTADRHCRRQMAQSPPIRTVGRAECALNFGSARRSEQLHRRRRRVKDLASPAEDRQRPAFLWSIAHAARGFEQRAGLVYGECEAIFVGLGGVEFKVGSHIEQPSADDFPSTRTVSESLTRLRGFHHACSPPVFPHG